MDVERIEELNRLCEGSLTIFHHRFLGWTVYSKRLSGFGFSVNAKSLSLAIDKAFIQARLWHAERARQEAVQEMVTTA